MQFHIRQQHQGTKFHFFFILLNVVSFTLFYFFLCVYFIDFFLNIFYIRLHFKVKINFSARGIRFFSDRGFLQYKQYVHKSRWVIQQNEIKFSFYFFFFCYLYSKMFCDFLPMTEQRTLNRNNEFNELKWATFVCRASNQSIKKLCTHIWKCRKIKKLTETERKKKNERTQIIHIQPTNVVAFD